MMTINRVDISVDLAYLDFFGMFDRKVMKMAMMTTLMENNQKFGKKIFTLKIAFDANKKYSRLN